MGYVVKSLMALIDCEGGTTVTVMQGGAVPEGVLPDHLDHLILRGLVAESPFVGGIVPTVAGDGSDDRGPLVLSVPARVAAKAAWVDYAVSQGAAQGEAEGYTKEQLIETYGG